MKQTMTIAIKQNMSPILPSHFPIKSNPSFLNVDMDVVTCPTCSKQFTLVAYLHHVPSCYKAKCRELGYYSFDLYSKCLRITTVCLCEGSNVNHPTIRSFQLSNHKQISIEVTSTSDSSPINTVPTSIFLHQ